MAEAKWFGDLSPVPVDLFVNQLTLLLLFPEESPMLERKGDE